MTHISIDNTEFFNCEYYDHSQEDKFFDCYQTIEEQHQDASEPPELPDTWQVMHNIALNLAFRMEMSNREPNNETLLPNFGWAPIKAIKKTFQASTQHTVELPNRAYMCNSLESANPALNIPRWNELVATDTLFSPICLL